MNLIIKKFFCIILGLIGLILFLNGLVILTTKHSVLSLEELKQQTNLDAILVLGCQVKADKTPSHMLEDRLKSSILLYQESIAPKMIMSGDHGTKYYNEVKVMKDYAISNGISSEDIFMDHAGFSTYDSIYRAKEVFKAKKIVIVSQGYHLYRALYIARSLGLEAYGYKSNLRTYAGQTKREIREILARNKDVFYSIWKVKPKYLGQEILVSGNGDLTNDMEILGEEK